MTRYLIFLIERLVSILNFLCRKENKTIHGGGMDLQILSALALPISIMFFLVGILIGWVARDYMMNYRELPRPHPEMFDINGNLVPDEVIAFRFENNYDYEIDEEDDN